MTAQERKQLSYLPCQALDAAIVKKFGKEIEPETFFGFVDMEYHTTFKTEDPALRARILDFVDGFTQALAEVRERIQDKNKWL
jgi:hypothetical protein